MNLYDLHSLIRQTDKSCACLYVTNNPANPLVNTTTLLLTLHSVRNVEPVKYIILRILPNYSWGNTDQILTKQFLSNVASQNFSLVSFRSRVPKCAVVQKFSVFLTNLLNFSCTMCLCIELPFLCTYFFPFILVFCTDSYDFLANWKFFNYLEHPWGASRTFEIMPSKLSALCFSTVKIRLIEAQTILLRHSVPCSLSKKKLCKLSWAFLI